MYNKIRKKQDDSILKSNNNTKNYLDRDSGIVTETESDIDLNRPNYIFSDDDDEVNRALNSLGDINNIPQDNLLMNSNLFNSPSYYSSMADQSVISIRHYLKDTEWKKVLKHKSGTTVYMLQNSVEKTALFRGESIIQGFTPQSIFYVIGMRKLWDEQFDEGKLIENLNDTTSLTYESYKSTTTSKAYDLTLVEKIECSADGEILFACTSVDTPKVPKTPGKHRNQIKLQGWILKQLHTTPVSTKVTYITQENIKGWIPGLTKKSLARKPLVIASIDNYLKKKADRLRLQQQQPTPQQQQPTPQQQQQARNIISSSSTLSLNNNNTTVTPSRLSPQSILLQHNNNSSTSSYNLSVQPSPTLGPSTSLDNIPPINTNNDNKKFNTIILSNPPPRISSLVSRSSSTNTKHITFADEALQQQQQQSTSSRSSSPMSLSAYTTSSSSARSSYNNDQQQQQQQQEMVFDPPQFPLPPAHHQLSPIHEMSSSPFSNNKSVTTKAIAGSKLYPASRHRSARKQCIDQLKAYANSDLSEWKCIGERNNRTKMYTQVIPGSVLPVFRSDSTFYGSWTPEQICSVVQCFGARKIWDEYFEDGHVVERFSQKEYLVYSQMKSIFPIQSRDFSILTCIESNVTSGVIYVGSTSVQDDLIPEVSRHMRGSYLTYGWALEPLKSTQHRLIGVKATFIAHLDMGGVTPLPSAISRLLTTEVPTCVDRVQSYLRQNGCPPYIRRVAGKITLEEFDDKDKQYTIHFIAKHAPSARQYRSRNSTTMIKSMWCTDLRIHLSMYPFGYTIETQPSHGVRVEMRPDAMGLRIYTEKDEMDGKTVEVLIRQNRDCSPGGKPQFSWNGIPLLEDEDEVRADEVIIPKADMNVPDAAAATAKVVVVSKGGGEEQLVVKKANHMNITSEQTIEEETNYKEPQRRNSNVIIISEELSFTGHQFSFIILLMAICYYLGKFSCKCSIE